MWEISLGARSWLFSPCSEALRSCTLVVLWRQKVLVGIPSLRGDLAMVDRLLEISPHSLSCDTPNFSNCLWFYLFLRCFRKVLRGHMLELMSKSLPFSGMVCDAAHRICWGRFCWVLMFNTPVRELCLTLTWDLLHSFDSFPLTWSQSIS